MQLSTINNDKSVEWLNTINDTIKHHSYFIGIDWNDLVIKRQYNKVINKSIREVFKNNANHQNNDYSLIPPPHTRECCGFTLLFNNSAEYIRSKYYNTMMFISPALSSSPSPPWPICSTDKCNSINYKNILVNFKDVMHACGMDVHYTNWKEHYEALIIISKDNNRNYNKQNSLSDIMESPSKNMKYVTPGMFT